MAKRRQELPKAPEATPFEQSKMYLNLLLWGPPGAGKTRCATSIAKHEFLRPAAVLSFEGGLLSTPVEAREHLVVINIKSTGDLEAAFWALKNGEYGEIKSVIIDSGSEMQTLDIEEVVSRAFYKDDSKRDNLDDVYLEDFGKSTSKLRRLFRWFRDLETHLIVTALSQEITKKQGKDVKVVGYRPAFTPKLASSVNGYFDFVWYISEIPDTDNRAILIKQRNGYYAKSRGDKFPNKYPDGVVTDPDLGEMIQQIAELEGLAL